MSLSKHTSPYQSMELSENRKRPMSSRSTPIACRVCDKVFFDNVSLVLHFECHLEDELSIHRLHGRDLAFLQNGRHLSLKLSPFSSSVEKMNDARRAMLPKMNKRVRPLSVSSAITPNAIPIDANLVDVPVLNSMPPVNSSFDARRNGQNLSKPFRHSTYPLMNSRAGTRSFAPGSTSVPRLQLRGQNGGQGDYKNPHSKQLEKPIPEIIVISDDEQDENKNADEIDLTLKL